MEARSILRSVPVLGEFGDDAIDRLARDSWFEEYSTGQLVLRLGQRVEAAGVVASGRVEAMLAGGARPAGLSPGDLFGEMSLLTGEPAIADVVAAVPSRILRVPHEALTREIGARPLAARALARLLAERLARRGEDPEEQSAVDLARRTKVPEAPDDRRGAVLVLNLGSSSIKYSVFSRGEPGAEGMVERVGLDGARLRHRCRGREVERDVRAPDHEAGLVIVLDAIVDPEIGAIGSLEDLEAVGHRTVHGGVRFTEATLVDAEVKEELKRASVLAPLHNPVNLLGIEICERLLPPGLPQVAVFDTAFHMTMPEHAYRYALPRSFADERQIRRFGFHGTSHAYVADAAAGYLGEQLSSLRMITCHLGNGSSVTAVDHGRSVDTSMGLTPLEGLVMGTRCGDLDPGVILHLLGQGMGREEVDRLLNRESGLAGLSGLSSDMRELEAAADAGHQGALLAIQVFCYRARKYVGAYTAAMGGLDALVFTGGIGENASGIRSRICHGLGCLGIRLDEELNRAPAEGAASARLVSADGSAVRVLVVPTDEEGMIARETSRALERSGVRQVLRARRDRPIPIGVSAHHVHLCQEHVEMLFGEGRTLTPRNELTQKGYFAAEETVDLVGPKGIVERVRVLGPVRPRSQVEISRTEEFKLGIDAPIRASGDVAKSPGVVLRGSAGEVDLEEGVICALRHIHICPEDALAFGLRDRDVVRVQVQGERSLIFGEVLVRVHPGWALEMHIDTDEANAAEVNAGMTAEIESIQRRSE